MIGLCLGITDISHILLVLLFRLMMHQLLQIQTRKLNKVLNLWRNSSGKLRSVKPGSHKLIRPHSDLVPEHWHDSVSHSEYWCYNACNSSFNHHNPWTTMLTIRAEDCESNAWPLAQVVCRLVPVLDLVPEYHVQILGWAVMFTLVLSRHVLRHPVWHSLNVTSNECTWQWLSWLNTH